MPIEYTPDNPLTDEEVSDITHQALPGRTICDVARVSRGSTNLVYKISTTDQGFILKIAYRPDRIAANILNKEAKMLDFFKNINRLIPIPKIIWQGITPQSFPAFIETALPGDNLEHLLNAQTKAESAMENLGQYVATLHGLPHPVIDEFETGRPPFQDFSAYVRHYLTEWLPLLKRAPHLTQAELTSAQTIIEKGLTHFPEAVWSYVHGDISQENLLGKLHDNVLTLTGLCDFENVQTGPPEYDFATIHDGLFLFFPHLEEPFFKGYTTVRPLPDHFEARMQVVCLFRALRYMKRTVKYNETHYLEHDRQYFLRWLKI